MLVKEEYVEVHALRRRGWSISAIARHLGRDRKTVRAYLSGERMPGERALDESDPFEPFEAYVRQRLSDDPHVWASALFEEVVALGYAQSYPTLVRKDPPSGSSTVVWRLCGHQGQTVGDYRSSTG
ncbi:MAG: hypothetical protein KTV45_10725 [Acidimicrobiia bacterium]|nr:hypothetical protein [Acidimicrobiia bacterium]